MARKLAKSSPDSTVTHNDEPKGGKALGRKEKLEAVRKANQAMMKAWELISLRGNDETIFL